MNKKFGFTLAEVLITLGIIGIVAAMTIPPLLANKQKEEYVTSLKKASAMFSQGMQQYIASKGVISISDTDLFDGTTYDDAARNDKIDTAIKSVFKVLKACKYNDNSCQIDGYTYLGKSNTFPAFGSGGYKFRTADGMIFGVDFQMVCSPNYNSFGPMKASCANVSIDINGAKKPNKFGRDYFNFQMGHDGTLYPMGGSAIAKYNHGQNWETGWSYWRHPDEIDGYTCGAPGSTDITNALGSNCAGRIEEEGGMKY